MGNHNLGNMECTKQGNLQTIPDPLEGNPGSGDRLAKGIPMSDGNTKDSMSFQVVPYILYLFSFTAWTQHN